MRTASPTERNSRADRRPHVLSFRLARDGRHVTVEQVPSRSRSDTYRGEVWIMDADCAARVLTKNLNFRTPELSPDNAQVLFLADMNDRFESYYNTTLFIVPAGGGTPKRVLPDTYSFDRASWGMDGKTIIAVINQGVHNEIVRIDVATGTVKPLTSGEHSIPAPPGPVWAGVEPHSGIVAAVFEDATRFGEIWTVSATSDAPAKRVTACSIRSRPTSRSRAGAHRMEEQRRHDHRGTAVPSDRLSAG